jgi:hypothetical protein
MDRERYIELDSAGEGLTPEEWERGWHWCLEWDGMLVGPNSHEALVCSCDHPAIEAWKASEDGKKLQKEIEERSDAVYNTAATDEALKHFLQLRETPEYKQRQEAMDRLARLDEELGLNEPNREDNTGGAA